MEGGGFADCLMVATVAAIVSYIPIGHISSKFGRRKTIMGGVLLMAACYGAAIFVNTYHPAVNIAFALIGVAWASINVNSYLFHGGADIHARSVRLLIGKRVLQDPVSLCAGIFPDCIFNHDPGTPR